MKVYDDEDNIGVLEQTIFPDKGVLYQQRIVCAEQKINLVQCRLFLTKLIAVFNRGDTFTQEEATELFFATTKLFYSPNVPLRQLLFTALRSVIPYACDVFVVMNSLSKDATSTYDFQRSSALRTLGMILTDQTINSLERHYKQGIVDKIPNVSVSALSTACKLALTHADVVAKWMPEISTALSSSNHLVQYQAIRLLHILKKHDRVALIRCVVTYGKEKPLRSPYAHVELLKICKDILIGERAFSKTVLPLVEYIQTSMRPNNDLVALEAIKLASQLELDAAPQSLSAQLMNSIQVYLQSNKTILRFEAIRVVSEMSYRYNELVSTVRIDVESLLRESNRAILTLAIATSLNICNESSIDGLLNKVAKFMSELPDSFRTKVVNTVEKLAERYPSKYLTLLSFLSHSLTIKGVKFQTAVVNTIRRLCIIQPRCRETSLTTLADYIEDCEYPEIIMKVFSFIGEEGPHSKKPMKYIRSIYNRLLLESPIIRAAGITTLSKFAEIPELKPNIIEILKKCAYDEDQEVRDRACFYSVFLDTPKVETPVITSQTDIDALQHVLEQYINGDCETPFDLEEESKKTIIIEPIKEEEVSNEVKKEQEIIEGFGEVIKKSEVTLTTTGSEYDVVCKKMIYKNNVVLLYSITNTLTDYCLSNVSIEIGIEKGDYKIIEQSTISSLPAQGSDIIKVVLDRPDSLIGTFSNKLIYTLKENIEDDTGDEDEYIIDNVSLNLSDFVSPVEIEDWNVQFESLSKEANKTQIFKFPAFKNLQIAVDKLKELFGLNVINGSDDAKKAVKKHVLLLAGNILLKEPATTFIRLRMLCDEKGVTVEVCIRSTNTLIPDMLLALL
ncbi:coatomer protein gamma subunit, putative [Entamoeba histolytica HM-1:IMSS-B]|uniref:Coatomer subunit gamma n=7 Tax=Entamoeba histolytica TaxID=5759 RepID=A0A8U0WPW7_ENTH1|nr:coatomer protein gamma subunit, putative [Entamoeba histolytica HM-1:IMSS]EMD47131.1 coatomer subunit gamma-2, putative [Entamoeba histolytica KU27]EMH77180.1 coatomer protein gamma subunit, putative [Entamoeba histolytica HM-1:IMSS-B]EMS14130.1 coatomer subunit gamma-2, putative [Entamoeba histolytica HM-3:IMSS]ENY64630.1 coatomer subunit gamma-2, putative [Entamoeba histolytica HM-1:IMSS-A]BAE94773.1 gamma1-COP [Entamoeba histolytica]|eukprot:XP_648199.1 coatomer protein gamma subunit, putative [Entamoeba histolytica HM-1:IMSS]